MLLRPCFTLLLFTVFSSLASGQWEADQFLFQEQSTESRPKTVKPKPSVVKDAGEKIQPVSEASVTKAPAVGPAEVPMATPDRRPAAITPTPVSLRAQAGYIDFSSKSSLKGLQFSEGAFSVGAEIGFQVEDSHGINFSYGTTAELQGVFEWNGRSLGRVKWEDLAIEYAHSQTWAPRDLVYGLSYRQNTWWGQQEGERLVLQQSQAVGLHGALLGASREGWRQQWKMQIFPQWTSLDHRSTGWGVALDWSGTYEFRARHALFMRLGLEKVSLESAGAESAELDQGMIKIFFGYRVSTR